MSNEQTPLLSGNNCKNGHASVDINSSSWKKLFIHSIGNNDRIEIDTPVYKMEQFLIHSKYSQRKSKPVSQILKSRLQEFRWKKFINSILPITEWLPNYSWSQDLSSDFIAGCTVAILGVPQSIAYALLGNVPAVIGLYMHFFPPLIYFLFGTSKQNSIGTFAVVCLMTGKIVTRVTQENQSYSATEVAATVALTAGLMQCLMYIFGLGKILKIFLSEPLVNGFTTASAIHVYATQIPEIFGLHLPRRIGTFKLIYVSIDIYNNITTVNYICVGLSFVCILCLCINNLIIKPWLAKRTNFPMPMELLLVICMTLISKYFHFENKKINVVGVLPTGIPYPSVPRVELIPNIAMDTISIAVVSFTLTSSMAIILAAKNFDEINCNQESLALGASNIFGSFFHCLPICASLSRSFVQEAVGGRTQTASVFSSVFILLVLLFISPFFETLPKIVLACIIVMALKNTVKQVNLLPKYWRLSKMDFIVFSSTLLIVTFVDIDIGLIFGFLISILVLIHYGMKPYTCLLGRMPDSDVYLNIKRHKQVEEIPKIKIFHYAGGLSFAQVDNFKNELYKYVKINPLQVVQSRKRELKSRGISNDLIRQSPEILTTTNNVENGHVQLDYFRMSSLIDFCCLIWDFSGVSYIDPSGVREITNLAKTFRSLNVRVFLAAPPLPVFETLRKFESNTNDNFLIYPSVHDAVLVAISFVKGTNSR